MKATKPILRQRGSFRGEQSPGLHLEQACSTPELAVVQGHARRPDYCARHHADQPSSTSETNLSARVNDSRNEEPTRLVKQHLPQDRANLNSGDMRPSSPRRKDKVQKHEKERLSNAPKAIFKQDRSPKCGLTNLKIAGSLESDTDESLSRQIRDIHNDTRKSTRVIRDSRARLLEIQKKPSISEADVKELGERNELLLREMDRFDSLTRKLQALVGDSAPRITKEAHIHHVPASFYESTVHHEMKMNHPTVLLAPGRTPPEMTIQPARSKSEIDLTRKLSESYDMQEKLVADNADLEVKRYILYKELMTKDQNLETCRAQVKRLQGELKLMSKENSLLQEKLSKNNPQGDATTLNDVKDSTEPSNQHTNHFDAEKTKELLEKLETYKGSTVEIEKLVGSLEAEVQKLRVEMDSKGGACRGGGGPNICFNQSPGGPPVPPMTRACGVCPPCPASCNPNAPPTPAERNLAKMELQYKKTEELYKTKVTECAMLRTDLMKKKDELAKEVCQHRETQNKLRELEMKFEGLTMQTNMLMGTKEQAFENEVNVRALKQCYREAREEIEELRSLLKEQNIQLQDYRVKYLQCQQLVEEQRKQMELLDLDNTRICEQINLEIQKVKLKFQEKLQELAPIPDLLKATQLRLKDAQQSQAIAEHNAEQLARELNVAREKVHILSTAAVKPPEKPAQDKGADEKQMAMLQQKIAQLTETNQSLKGDIDRLKANVIRVEEMSLTNERRLQEKMHECAALGGELDRAREEASRALGRANERTEVLRKCMQTTIAELERQLASARAQVKNGEKDREEIQHRMDCQIKRLNDNFEQAQYRILGLQAQVQALHRTTSATKADGDGDQQECECKSFFDVAK